MKFREYGDLIAEIHTGLPSEKRGRFLKELAAVEKNPLVVFGFSLFLGGLGIDRFIIGDILLGFLKLFTGGGLGIWTIVDWFVIGGRTRDKNAKAARAIAASITAS